MSLSQVTVYTLVDFPNQPPTGGIEPASLRPLALNPACSAIHHCRFGGQSQTVAAIIDLASHQPSTEHDSDDTAYHAVPSWKESGLGTMSSTQCN